LGNVYTSSFILSACLDYTDEEEICPSCGNLTVLVESSGWCADCTKHQGICIDCGNEIPPAHQRILCWDCKEERWLKKYGDVIEYLMLTGMSFGKARTMVADAIRPLCVVCGGPIKGGTPGESLFCSSNLRCKTARNKYRRLQNKGVAPNRALNMAIKL
jgi:hypothetical protein